MSDEERFGLSDEAYKGTVIILFEIPEGWKWKIIHINNWDDSRFTGFEPLPLIRLFPEDAIALLRRGKVTRIPMLLLLSFQAVGWHQYLGMSGEVIF